MNESEPFSIAKRLKSFVYAFRGIGVLIATQHNAWIHILATVLVLGMGFSLSVSRVDWLFLSLAITLVWVGEAFNTAIEFLANAVSEEYDENIKYAKDVAAGAVLLAAIGATVLAALVFLPYF
ncbi:MAG: diacylglycerol kinase family protein [Pseudomonadales bacterium]